MNINKNSWHYKLASIGDGAPRTLCPYFWKVVWVLFLFLFVAFMLGFASAYTGLPTATWLFAKAGISAGFMTSAVSAIFIGLIYISSTLGGCILLAFGVHTGIEKTKDVINNRPKKEDGLVKAYIKARKAKWCPVLEFTEGDK